MAIPAGPATGGSAVGELPPRPAGSSRESVPLSVIRYLHAPRRRLRAVSHRQAIRPRVHCRLRDRALGAGGPANGDAAGPSPRRGLPGAGRSASPAAMVPDRRAHHRKIPLACHLRVTPSPGVRSYRPQMKETQPAGRTGMGGPAHYEIRVAGVLDGRWAAWFGGLQISGQGEETVISGLLADQAALHGVLTKVRDLGLCLISVRRLDTGQAGPRHLLADGCRPRQRRRSAGESGAPAVPRRGARRARDGACGVPTGRTSTTAPDSDALSRRCRRRRRTSRSRTGRA